MSDLNEKWINVGSVSRFETGMHTITAGRQRVVVAKLNGRLFAFDAFCPHVQGPMDKAEVEGAIISCPLHAWRFDLENGGKELHGYRSLTVHDVRIDNDQVFLALDS
jgi:nitrite reductase/ring-hydroxylating ferredoxin subunit